MKNILFYQDAALELNKRAQKDISRHLIMFCNYDPSLPVAVSVDAQFLKAVTNLYKLLVDSGIIRLISEVSKAGEFNSDIKVLKQYRNLANMLRTVVGHNPTVMTGKDENQLRYEEWLREYSGKDKIETEDDYKKPLQELERIADEIVSILENFIASAAGVPDRQKVVDAWETAIIDFYCKNSNIFKTQINIFYRAIHHKKQNASLQNWEVPVWIRDDYYFKQENQRLAILKSQPIDKADSDLKDKISEAIKNTEEELELKKTEIANKSGHKVNELNGNVYYYEDYYFSELKPKLQKIMVIIRQSQDKTMMPHDLMQELFYEDFVNSMF